MTCFFLSMEQQNGGDPKVNAPSTGFGAKVVWCWVSPWNPKGIERLIDVDQLEVYGAAVAMPQIARSKELR